jgi:3-oxoacyl-[acyl-carrier protein] reductase
MIDLKNRVALVTGSSRGIGAGVAIALVNAGADVAVNFRERADAANAVCGKITGIGRKAIAVQADVSVGGKENGDASSICPQLPHRQAGL